MSDWIECEYEMPILDDDTIVHIKFRDGYEVYYTNYSDVDWAYFGNENDIVAYRLPSQDELL